MMTFDLALAIECIYVAAKYAGSTNENTRAAYDALIWRDERQQPTWEELQVAWEESKWPTWDPDGIERESTWVVDEMAVIAEQLLMIEDGDPGALPGTDRQWRDYRIALRAWKDGAEHYPDMQYRPQRPA